jgi:hypothetical protein
MNVYCTVDYIKNEYTFLQGQVLKVKSVSYECMQSSNEVLLYRGPSIDAFYQVLVHFGHAVLEEKIFF